MTEVEATSTEHPLLALDGIHKQFGSVEALAGVDLTVGAGETHALLGENGAGKTTLMNIAAGIFQPDGGSIRVAGGEVVFRSPKEAFRAGIGMVHQSYRLVGTFTVAENVHLGWDEAPAVCSAVTLEDRTAALAERFGLKVDPAATTSRLSVGQQQRVAILRTLARGARILILDEPTAALTPQEASYLFEIVNRLKAEGRSVIFISHKLHEVLEIADEITVLRGGKQVRTLDVEDATVPLLAHLMVGEGAPPEEAGEGAELFRAAPELGPVMLRATGARVDDGAGLSRLKGLDLEIRAGEVLGVAGVSGNGQAELAEVLTGLRSLDGGEIEISDGGRPSDPAAFIGAGVGHVPEDPRTGLAFKERLEANAVLKSLDLPELNGRGRWLSWSAVRDTAREILDRAGLNKVQPDRLVSTLSGGQAQRLLVQRELQTSRRVLVAVHPTRGLDVAGIRHVHTSLQEAKLRGTGIILISEDLDELFALSDRMMVLYEGEEMATIDRDSFDRDQIGVLMGGAALAEPREAGEPVDARTAPSEGPQL